MLAALRLAGRAWEPAAGDAPPRVVDSTWLIRHAVLSVPGVTVVILRDGYNSLVELHDALPWRSALRRRPAKSS